MKKRNISTLILVLVFLVGLSILLYPTISDWWNSRVQSRAIADYEAVIADLSKEDYEAEFAAADAYNAALKQIATPLVNYARAEGYDNVLNIAGNGMMGYIHIPRISLELPIYHGTSEAVLNTAVGHLEGTSLPVGGKGNHCVLSAHRGLPSAKLFTYLDKLAEGDTFTIIVLDRLLTYEVDQIRIVDPGDVGELEPKDGEDYVTLLTCTPYGINTQRLLVRGHRIDNALENSLSMTNEAYEMDSTILAPLVAAPLLLMLLVILLVKSKRPGRRTDRNKREEKKKHE